MIELIYKDTATFVKVSSTGYGDTKVASSQAEVSVIFIQNTQYNRSNNQDSVQADAVCWPDVNSTFIKNNYNRLEGMYILEPLYGAGDNASWYKITDVTINRDHLLENRIDNIELRLKKSTPIPGVS